MKYRRKEKIACLEHEILTRQEMSMWHPQTNPTIANFPSSRAAKVMTPQQVWQRTMHRQRAAEIMKKFCGSPLNPTVPGPRLSARTLTRLKAPDMRPKPRPTTSRDIKVKDP